MTQRRAEGPHRVVQLALLTAIALTIFMVEAQLPVLVPIQGVKLGLANIVTVYAVFALGPGDALLILLSRVFLGAVFSGQMSTLLYSAGGGLLCWLALCLLRRVLSRDQICVHQGYISDGSQPIVCLPNRLIIQIQGGGDALDAAAG